MDKLKDIIEIEIMQTFFDNKEGDKLPIGQLVKRLTDKYKEYLKKELLSRIANNSHLERNGENVRRVVEVEIVSNIIHELD